MSQKSKVLKLEATPEDRKQILILMMEDYVKDTGEDIDRIDHYAKNDEDMVSLTKLQLVHPLCPESIKVYYFVSTFFDPDIVYGFTNQYLMIDGEAEQVDRIIGIDWDAIINYK